MGVRPANPAGITPKPAPPVLKVDIRAGARMRRAGLGLGQLPKFGFRAVAKVLGVSVALRLRAWGLQRRAGNALGGVLTGESE